VAIGTPEFNDLEGCPNSFGNIGYSMSIPHSLAFIPIKIKDGPALKEIYSSVVLMKLHPI